MSGCVLDAWAVISVARRQAGAETVRHAIEEGGAVMSWINLGEVFYILARLMGADRAQSVVDNALLDARVERPNGRLVMAAARLKATFAMSYADCFAVATAQHHGLVLLTADREIVESGVAVEVVDLRDKP
jgi:predicted nucleic acid-binding protein